MYRGEGYSFHSTLEPEDADISEDIGDEREIFIEAKPRSTKEARLTDAKFTLGQLQGGYGDFTIIERARILRLPRYDDEGEFPLDDEQDPWNDDPWNHDQDCIEY